MSGLDFSRINTKSTSDSATEPRRIFSALPSKHKNYGYPRDVQSEVWETWHERRKERDLVVKMNTGSGKTIVGLVMLKSCLNEGVGPAAYIAPDIYLTQQVVAESRRLGIETTDDPESPAFLQGKAVLVANIYKLFNGRSRFGVKGSGREPIVLGSVLIDDAHACLATVKDQFTLKVKAGTEPYDELFELFARDLTTQAPAKLRDLEAGDFGAILPIPFWAWADKGEKVMEILHPHRDSEELRFNWPLLVECLPFCRSVISELAIEIAPPCPPIEMISSFDRADRRIYLSATLSDDSVLVTHFGADPKGVRDPISPRNANDLGDRMILTPQRSFPECDDGELRDFVAEQSKVHNTVVIVPSWARAQSWEDWADETHGSEGLETVLGDLRSRHVGLVVLVNKYDGIDLPDKACRLLVIDGLPEALGALDRWEQEALEGSDALVARQIQRIEQGMGRGTRSNDDYCAILLLGKRLTARLHSARDKFSAATRAQLVLSDQMAAMLEDHPFEDLGSVVGQCLDRDQAWVAASRDALDGVTYPEHSFISPAGEASRAAFDLAFAGRFPAAADRLQQAIDGSTDRRLRGVLKEEAAIYLHQADPAAAQKLQTSAFSDNRALTRPFTGIAYKRFRDSKPQGEQAAEFLKSKYENPEDLVLAVGGLLEQLIPDPDEAAVFRFEQAMLELAPHLGLQAQRPELELGHGPDVLWSLGESSYWVIECKSGSEQASIPKHDMAQLSHSMDWFSENYGDPHHATPVLIAPTRDLDPKASAASDTRILTFDKLEELRGAIQGFATAVVANRPYCAPEAIWERLVASDLNAGSLQNRWTASPKPSRR